MIELSTTWVNLTAETDSAPDAAKPDATHSATRLDAV